MGTRDERRLERIEAQLRKAPPTCEDFTSLTLTIYEEVDPDAPPPHDVPDPDAPLRVEVYRDPPDVPPPAPLPPCVRRPTPRNDENGQ